jgi:hypothetical protein
MVTARSQRYSDIVYGELDFSALAPFGPWALRSSGGHEPVLTGVVQVREGRGVVAYGSTVSEVLRELLRLIHEGEASLVPISAELTVESGS